MGKASDFRVSEKIQEAGLILGALGVVGFIGVIWLLIYGNLDGNLGFGQDTLSFSNETITLVSSGNTPNGASNRINGVISSTAFVMTNASAFNATNPVLTTDNFTISGVIIASTVDSEFNNTDVNVSYTVAFDSNGKVSTDNVITNLTGGFNTFFTFSNTFFTIAAIVLLIFMFLGLLAIVVLIMRMQQGKNKGFSE